MPEAVAKDLAKVVTDDITRAVPDEVIWYVQVLLNCYKLLLKTNRYICMLMYKCLIKCEIISAKTNTWCNAREYFLPDLKKREVKIDVKSFVKLDLNLCAKNK